MNTLEENFSSPKEMINWLMDNEGKELSDYYGRMWKYENYSFSFKDIGKYDKWEIEAIKCLHLFKTFTKPQTN